MLLSVQDPVGTNGSRLAAKIMLIQNAIECVCRKTTPDKAVLHVESSRK
jgi:hypothetical protein